MVTKRFVCVYLIVLFPCFSFFYTIFIVSNEILENVKNVINIQVLKIR